MIPIEIKSLAARKAADDARIAAARAAVKVQLAVAPEAATREQEVLSRYAAALEVKYTNTAPSAPGTAPVKAAPVRRAYKGWGAPLAPKKDRLTVPDVYRAPERPACKRQNYGRTWITAKQTRVSFSAG
jgi:hypothetical protein